MKSLTESPALLTVHAGAPGQYIIRVSDSRYRPLVIGVSKLLDDASAFLLITPTDVKYFNVSGNGNAPGPEPTADDSAIPDDSAPPQLDAETQAAIDAELRTRPRTTQPLAETTQPESETEPPRARRRKKPDSVAGHDESCGRCGGTGRMSILVEGGKPAETSCAICQGTGQIRRYGARR